MNSNHQKFLVPLLFLNACGAWVSWLSLGPLLLKHSSSLIAFGGFALIRQFCSFLGTLLGEAYSSKIDRVGFNLLIEAALVILNLIAFVGICFVWEDLDIIGVLAWGSLRYLMGGVTVVSVYRLLIANANQSRSLVVQLGISQGSVLVGAALALAVSYADLKTSVLIALVLDMTSSLALIAYMRRLRLGAIVDRDEVGFGPRIANAISSFFLYTNKYAILGFIFGLVGISAVPTTFLYFSSKSESVLGTYSALNMFNGGCLLCLSVIASKAGYRDYIFKVFGLGVIATFIVTFILLAFDSMSYGLCALSLGATSVLIAIHYLAIEKVAEGQAQAFRSSMALVLTIVFGVSEVVTSKLFDLNGMRVVLVAKFFCVAISFLCFYRLRWR